MRKSRNILDALAHVWPLEYPHIIFQHRGRLPNCVDQMDAAGTPDKQHHAERNNGELSAYVCSKFNVLHPDTHQCCDVHVMRAIVLAYD